MGRMVAASFALAAALGAADPPRLVVVAPQALNGALSEYVAWRSADLPVEVATLESVLASTPGADDPEKMKRYLFDAWRERGVRYALLVGDADVFPVRYMALDRVTAPAFDVAFYPSDLYYADLAKRDGSFDDWNASREGHHAGYFGEVRGEKNKSGPVNFDAIDYRPEIAVGRWPVSTPEETARVARKTMAFEARSPSRTAAFICVDGWIDARGMLDAAIAKLPRGWSAERRYYAREGERERTPPPDAAEAVRLVNAGATIVFHAGHGEDHGWSGSLGSGDLGKLDNAAAPAIFFSIGCSTARFATLPPYEAYEDVEGRAHAGTNAGEVFAAPPPAPYARGPFNPPGFGERLLREGPSGAAAYVGCNTGGQPCAATLLDGFVTALGDTKERPRLGDLWARAVTLYFERENLETLEPTESWYPPSIFFQGMKYMLFGDPAMRLPGPSD